MFKGGVSGNPAGKKPGTKDKKWATLQYWFERLQKTLDDSKLPLAVRAQIELKMTELLMARKQLPPDTPEDSVENARAAQALLKALEDNGPDRIPAPESR